MKINGFCCAWKRIWASNEFYGWIKVQIYRLLFTFLENCFFKKKNFLFVVHNSFAIKFTNVNHTKLVWSLDLCTIWELYDINVWWKLNKKKTKLDVSFEKYASSWEMILYWTAYFNAYTKLTHKHNTYLHSPSNRRTLYRHCK